MPTYHRTFCGRPEEIRRARHWTTTVLNGSSSTHKAALIVTELGTNALLHTATGSQDGSFHVTLTRSEEEIAIAVTDP